MGNRAVYFFCSPRLVSLSLLRAYGATACCQQSHQFLWISITFHTMENFRMFRTVEHFFPYFFCVFVSLREENFCNVFLLRQNRVEMDGGIWVKNDSEFKTNEWSTSAIYGPTQWHECVVFFFFSGKHLYDELTHAKTQWIATCKNAETHWSGAWVGERIEWANAMLSRLREVKASLKYSQR